MKCPVCQQEMVEKKADKSFDQSNGKEYNRTIYWCEKDDVWVEVEIPAKKENI